jgi:hypothetical protein
MIWRKDMEKRDIIQGFEAARAKTFVFMAQAIIEELGEEEGKKKVLETVWKMSKSSGEAARDSYLERCVEPSWRNHRESNGPVYALAWDGGVIVNEDELKVVEYSFCPLGDAFSKLGKNGEMLGDLYCSVTDNAFWSGFNPDWVVVREKSFSKDGVCRLIWKRSKL